MKRFSIIVCAYNSERTIITCLQSISDLGNSDFELILVDNNSSDNTYDAAKSFLLSGGIASYNLIREYTPGLLNARKAGIRVAQGEYVVFVDDDNYLSSDYLEVANGLLTTFNQLLIGPKTVCYWDNSFESKVFACGRQYRESSVLKYKDTLWGCGLILPLNLARDVIHSVELSGRKGDVQLAGDDTEICLLSYLHGFKGYYCDDLVLYHDISISRLENANYTATLNGFKSSFLRIYDLKEKVYRKYHGQRAIYQWALDTIKSEQNLIFALYRYAKFFVKTKI